jgi:hypothetical protein
VLVLAVRGDRPEPRMVEALPAVLARRKFRVPLVSAFADIHDPRVRGRLAWLSEVTLTLSRLASFPWPIGSETQLRDLRAAGIKSAEPDSLGHPGDGPRPPAWRRWNITYAGTIQNFLSRLAEVAAADSPGETPWEDEA